MSSRWFVPVAFVLLAAVSNVQARLVSSMLRRIRHSCS